MPGPVEVEGEGLGVGAGGLQAGLDLRGAVPGEPGGELGEAGGRIRERLVAELGVGAREAGVELELGDVDAERGQIHQRSPREECSWREGAL